MTSQDRQTDRQREEILNIISLCEYAQRHAWVNKYTQYATIIGVKTRQTTQATKDLKLR